MLTPQRNCEQRKRQSRLQIIESENEELRSRLMEVEEPFGIF